MRDPNRIPEMLNRIKPVWQTYPDIRLGQLIDNAMDGQKVSLFHIEDDKLLELIENFYKK